jgi:hypothetical protein
MVFIHRGGCYTLIMMIEQYTATQEAAMKQHERIRYHLNTTQPVSPPLADAIYPAQLCTDGHYRQCSDVCTYAPYE